MKALIFILTLLLAPSYPTLVNADSSVQVAHEVPCCVSVINKAEADGEEGNDELLAVERLRPPAPAAPAFSVYEHTSRNSTQYRANGIRAPPLFLDLMS